MKIEADTIVLGSNLFSIALEFNPENWYVFRLELLTEIDSKTSHYELLKNATRFESPLQCETVSFGHLLAICVSTNNVNLVNEKLTEIQKYCADELEIELSKVSFESVPFDEWIHDNNTGINLFRQLVGLRITHLLHAKGFTKVSSSRGAGRFKIPETIANLQSIPWHKAICNIEILRYLDVGVSIHQTVDDKYVPLLLLDTVTEIQGKRTLKEAINTLARKNNWISREDLVANKNSLLKMIGKSQPRFRRKGNENGLDSCEELYYLEDLVFDLPLDEITTYRHLRNKPLKNILNRLGYTNIDESDFLAVLKPRNAKDPNVFHRWPTSILVHRIDTRALKDRDHSRTYRDFAIIPPRIKYNLVIDVLKAFDLFPSPIKENKEFSGKNFSFPTPTIGTKFQNKPYGFFPRLTENGVEEWGELQELFIIWGLKTGINYQIFKPFWQELERTFNQITQKSNLDPIRITPLNHYSTDPYKFTDSITKDTNIALVVIGDNTRTYKDFKIRFTLKREQAIQYIRLRTLNRMARSRKLPMFTETLSRQIIAKTGGLPYKLSPSILPNAIVVGMDRARDSYGKKTSASAGVAAVLPDGRYLTGVSTKVDPHPHDFIAVQEVAPPFIEELKRRNIKPELAIILRDGSPITCRNEVGEWLKYLKAEDIDLIFCASTKAHPYRLYPRFEKGEHAYKFPIGITHEPRDPTDFMVLTTIPPSGTPRPGLYTIMKNTTEKSDTKIQETLLPIISSMSMLCWESPKPTSQPLPLHYADKLATFTQLTEQAWNPENPYPMFI